MSCSTWKCFPAAISGGVDISKVPLMTDEFSVRVHKNYFKDCCLINSQPTFLFSPHSNILMAISSKGQKLDKFVSHNCLKTSFTNIWGLHSNSIEYKSFLESNSPDILALFETNLHNCIDSGNFSVRSYLHLTWKNYITHITHIHGLAV